MSRKPAVQVVQLTPPGRGAIATLLVEGAGAVELLRFHFRPNSGRPLESRPAGQLVVGRFGREPGEEVVARRRSDESVELHCHGGHAAVAMIQEVLVEGGGRVVTWQDWAAGHHQDPIAAAAHVALAEARTERSAAILLDQYQGALRRALDQIEEALRNGDVSTASRQIETLMARAELGRHLTRPWRVVLSGRTNVGKSSLINALVGYPRAIVHHTPGTTRDVVSVTTAVDGWPIELSDTAGLPTASGASEVPEAVEKTLGESVKEEALQQAGIQRAREKTAGAELVILVFDASLPWSPADQASTEAWPEGLVVHNKCDLPPAAGGRAPGVCTSALQGVGIEALAQAIADRLVPHPPPAGAAVPFTAGQIEHLAGCRLRAGGDKRTADDTFGGNR